MSTNPIGQVIEAWKRGEPEALNELIRITYPELRRTAHGLMRRERGIKTLQATELIGELFQKLLQQDAPENPKHFFRTASRMMRNVLTDYARKKNAQKRGGDSPALSLDELPFGVADSDEKLASLWMLEWALTRLEKRYPRQAQAWELKFYGGLRSEEVASLLECSRATVYRDLDFAQSFLTNEIAGPSPKSKEAEG